MARNHAKQAALKQRCRICNEPIWQNLDHEWMHVNGSAYLDRWHIHDAEPASPSRQT